MPEKDVTIILRIRAHNFKALVEAEKANSKISVEGISLAHDGDDAEVYRLLTVGSDEVLNDRYGWKPFTRRGAGL